ncbi:MAG: HAD family hydrolase [Acidimicrobiales bacterium]
MVIRAVVFDLDGVLIESEQLWDEVRREVAASHGRTWTSSATADMQGMSAPEWSGYMHDRIGIDLAPERIDEIVVDRLLGRYEASLPLLPGAVDAVRRLAARWPIALASSSNRVVIDRVLDRAGLDELFTVTVSSEEVARGKPDPDVYVEAAHRLDLPTDACVAVEDSANGIRSAAAAGMLVVAVPNRDYSPPLDVLAVAAVAVGGLEALTVELIEAAGRRQTHREQRIDEEEAGSFPSSDPHSDWAGPPG